MVATLHWDKTDAEPVRKLVLCQITREDLLAFTKMFRPDKISFKYNGAKS